MVRKIMMIALLCLAFAVIYCEDRDVGYGISNSLYIFTGGSPNGGMTFETSNTLMINTNFGSSGYDISEAIAISTGTGGYSSYRIMPVSQAPNPVILDIPEGGYGYAWFVVEGEENGVWLPVLNTDLVAEDAQGNNIACQTGWLPYRFLSSIIHMQNAGAFAVPIPSTLVGNGAPGSMETITVITADGETIAPENQQSITCRIVPYEYKEEWGYRLYAKGGAGGTAGIVTATGFGGGGSGATISLDLQGLGSNPSCSAFRINRRDDVFVGAEIELGPPRLIDIGEASVEVQASFPYEIEYNFDLDDLDGLESLMAFYLITEPTILYANSTNFVGQLSARFLSLCVQSLISHSAFNGLGIARVSDEAGLDIQGSLDLSVNLLAGLPLGLTMGPGLGAKAHLGGSLKAYESGAVQKRLFVGGEYKTTTNIGLKLLNDVSLGTKFFYPHKLRSPFFPSTRNVEFELTSNWDSLSDWESLEISGKVGSTSPSFKLYNLPGQMQEQRAWLGIHSSSLKNLLLNTAYAPVRLFNIGSAAVDMVANNETFNQDISNFMGVIYQNQNSNLPVQLNYGFEIEDKSGFEYDLDLEFPLPVIPALVIKLGGGLEATNSRSYKIAEGYWVKGYPYLQREMQSPPTNNIELTNVLNTLWNGMISGPIWSELCDLVLTEFVHAVLTWHFPFRDRMDEVLNANGSYITLTQDSFPADVDSVDFRYWDWGEDTEDPRLSGIQLEQVKRYNSRLRKLREEAIGMHYGIGGFYRFEADSDGWNEDPTLTIKYLDSEVTDIDESTLNMYWEDDHGAWHLLNSIAVPDSNLVRANIPYFATYTLAPSLPQGQIELSAAPDSLMADGISTALVSSGLLMNNDGSVVANGTLYTVLADRGEIVTLDADPMLTGIQIEAWGGYLNFTVQADSIPVPIVATVTSVTGFASGNLTIPMYATGLPATPVLLSAQPEHRALSLSWQQLPDPGIVGYRIHYDTDASGPPYDGVSSEAGHNSPVTVGNSGQHTLTGLQADQDYYLAITALDAYGNESPLSNELTGHTVLQAVTGLSISKSASGVSLAWEPAYGAVSYKVYRSATPSFELNQMEYLGETFDPAWLDQSAGNLDSCFYIVISIGY